MTTKLDQKRKLVVAQVKKFEQAAHEIHELADQLHQKMETVHMEAAATRQRARAALKQSQARTDRVQQAPAKSKPRKVT